MTGPQQPYGYGQPPAGYPPPRRTGLPVWLVVVLGVAGLGVALLALVTCAALVATTDTDARATATAPPSMPSLSPAGEVPPASGPAGPPPATGPTGLWQHPEDVEIVTCGRGAALGWGEARVRVTNNSAEASTYSVSVAFESPDGGMLHGEGWAYVSRLEPGQTTEEEVSALDEVPADVACRLTGAQRTRDY